MLRSLVPSAISGAGRLRRQRRADRQERRRLVADDVGLGGVRAALRRRRGRDPPAGGPARPAGLRVARRPGGVHRVDGPLVVLVREPAEDDARVRADSPVPRRRRGVAVRRPAALVRGRCSAGCWPSTSCSAATRSRRASSRIASTARRASFGFRLAGVFAYPNALGIVAVLGLLLAVGFVADSHARCSPGSRGGGDGAARARPLPLEQPRLLDLARARARGGARAHPCAAARRDGVRCRWRSIGALAIWLASRSRPVTRVGRSCWPPRTTGTCWPLPRSRWPSRPPRSRPGARDGRRSPHSPRRRWPSSSRPSSPSRVVLAAGPGGPAPPGAPAPGHDAERPALQHDEQLAPGVLARRGRSTSRTIRSPARAQGPTCGSGTGTGGSGSTCRTPTASTSRRSPSSG